MSENSGHVGEQDFRKLVLARLGSIEQMLETMVKLLLTVVKDQDYLEKGQDDLHKRVTKLDGESAA